MLYRQRIRLIVAIGYRQFDHAWQHYRFPTLNSHHHEAYRERKRLFVFIYIFICLLRRLPSAPPSMVHSSTSATRRMPNRFSAIFPSTSQTPINVLNDSSALARSQSIGRESRLRTPLTVSSRSLHNGVSLSDTLRILATATPSTNHFIEAGRHCCVK